MYKKINKTLPPERNNVDSYKKFIIVPYEDTIEASSVYNSLRTAELSELVKKGRHTSYNPIEGRLFYLTDLSEKTEFFWWDLYNKCIIHYEWLTTMLDIIANRESSDDSEEYTDRQIARYESWEVEFNFMDSVLKHIKHEFPWYEK